MRFAGVLAALAALWVQPAGAATYVGTLNPGETSPMFYADNFSTVTFRAVFSRPVSGYVGLVYAYDYHRYYLGVETQANDLLYSAGTTFADSKLVDYRHFLPPIEGWTGPGSYTQNTRIWQYFGFGIDNLSEPLDYRITISGSQSVPEPATWALMIAGFGVIGTAMRRRTIHRCLPA